MGELAKQELVVARDAVALVESPMAVEQGPPMERRPVGEGDGLSEDVPDLGPWRPKAARRSRPFRRKLRDPVGDPDLLGYLAQLFGEVVQCKRDGQLVASPQEPEPVATSMG